MTALHLSTFCTLTPFPLTPFPLTPFPPHRIGVEGVDHGSAAHTQYTERVDQITQTFTENAKSRGIKPGALSGKDAEAFAKSLISEIEHTNDPYVSQFNQYVREGRSQEFLQTWGRQYKANVYAGRTNDVWFKRGGKGFAVAGGKVVNSIREAFACVGRNLSRGMWGIGVGMSVAESKAALDEGESIGEVARTQFYRFGSLSGETPEEMIASHHNFSESFLNVIFTGYWETNIERDRREEMQKIPPPQYYIHKPRF